jgi:uncharacterized phiE125 gp8 family phage protein
MPSILLNGPAVEPLALAEAKAYLRVETSDEDETIAALIAAARLHVEAQTRRALITQSWRLTLDAWPECGRVTLRPAPLQSLSAARVYDANNVAHALDLQNFVPDLAASSINFASWAVAQPERAASGIELDVVCGYGDGAEVVPEALRQAIRLLVAHWYENRGLVVPGAMSLASLPSTAAALIAPYRMVSL